MPKKRLPFKVEFGSIVLASLLGTYLDLYFVGKGYYHFPIRPFPEIFSINILFTLIGLPFLTLIVLRSISELTNWGKAGVILLTSLLMPIIEKLLEILGLFQHSHSWNHLYTFLGYGLFFTIVVLFHEWMGRRMD
ncbi:hypothetical protein CVD27_18395 [Neobacillus cucumis]|uniref:Group-specific protein n=1 Tax=Neobacillus cucumis TaxID=1740721 RepID=A0A2N5HBB0_9BACI|nr:hypothetical protein CVD27_18395 [Neobacillus cucumis]